MGQKDRGPRDCIGKSISHRVRDPLTAHGATVLSSVPALDFSEPKPLVPAVKAKSAEGPPKSLASSQPASSHAKEAHSLVTEEDQKESSAKVLGKRQEEEAEVQLAGCKPALNSAVWGQPVGMRPSQGWPKRFPQALKARPLSVDNLGTRASKSKRKGEGAEDGGGRPGNREECRWRKRRKDRRRSHVGRKGAACREEDRRL